MASHTRDANDLEGWTHDGFLTSSMTMNYPFWSLVVTGPAMTIPLSFQFYAARLSPPSRKAATTRRPKAADVAMVMDRLNVHKADLVTHDIGNMVGYALAPQFADRISKWLSVAAPLRGIGSSGAA
jgi:pimeloyl-ACP methyl ester carboxylesterase